MKSALFTAVLLVAGTASANLDSVTICNPKNKAESISVSVKGKEMTITVVLPNKTETQAFPISATVTPTAEELRDVASNAGLTVNLEEGRTYGLEQDGMLIARDAKGVKYLFQVLGKMSQLLGESESCK